MHGAYLGSLSLVVWPRWMSQPDVQSISWSHHSTSSSVHCVLYKESKPFNNSYDSWIHVEGKKRQWQHEYEARLHCVKQSYLLINHEVLSLIVLVIRFWPTLLQISKIQEITKGKSVYCWPSIHVRLDVSFFASIISLIQ